MALLVAVKQRGAGVGGGEFDLGLGLSADQHDIFDDAADAFGRRILSGGNWCAEAAQLEAVPVQMQWMIVALLLMNCSR